MDKNKPEIQIYTDGACSGNPGPGGWGAYIIYQNIDKQISGFELETTNNRMELTAAIEALKFLKKPCSIDIYTDSNYVRNGITSWIDKWQKNQWLTSKNKAVKNHDLWQSLYHETQKHQVRWHWVKGHASNKGNIITDSLAVKAKNEAKIK